MSGTATYKPIVGVAGKPVAAIPFGLTGKSNYGYKRGVVMESPDPYGHTGYVRDVYPDTIHPKIILLDNGIECSASGGEYLQARHCRFNLHYIPGKVVCVTFQHNLTGGYIIGDVTQAAENIWPMGGESKLWMPSISPSDPPSSGTETFYLNNLYYRFPVVISLSAAISEGCTGWAKITLTNV